MHVRCAMSAPIVPDKRKSFVTAILSTWLATDNWQLCCCWHLALLLPYRSLSALPPSLGNLSSLHQLTLCLCWALVALPESLGRLSSLESLSIHYMVSLVSLPESLGQLTGLKRLSILGCPDVFALPSGINRLTGLEERTIQLH